MNEINDIKWIIYFGILNVWEAKRFGIPKGQVSPLYKGCRGFCLEEVIEGASKRSSSLEFSFLSSFCR